MNTPKLKTARKKLKMQSMDTGPSCYETVTVDPKSIDSLEELNALLVSAVKLVVKNGNEHPEKYECHFLHFAVTHEGIIKVFLATRFQNEVFDFERVTSDFNEVLPFAWSLSSQPRKQSE